MRGRPGRPARITRQRVIDVAKTMDPSSFTMKAVADELGVDPSAVNYHVSDRETLRKLVATEIVGEWIGGVQIPEDVDWREALRIFATAMRDALIATGSPNVVFDLSSESVPGAFALVEDVYRRLRDIGLQPAEAGSVLTAVNMVAFAAAREVVMSAAGEHPQLVELRQAIADSPDTGSVEEIVDHWNPASDSQFAFTLGLLISGVESLFEPSLLEQ